MRTKMRSITGFLLGVLVLSLMAACGGGGGGSAPVTKVGKFIDGPVAGVQYQGSHVGSTASGERQGEYTFNEGSRVRFFIGNITLGETNAKVVVTPIDLVPNSNESTPAVLNIVRLLMTLGTLDGNNNISLDAQTINAAKGVPATTVASLTEEQLAALVQAVKPGATLVTPQAASAHLATCLGNISQSLAGKYQGTMDPYGWTTDITVTADGKVSGTLFVGGQPYDEITSGTINGTSFTAATREGCTFTGTIDTGTGRIQGQWSPPPGSTNLGGAFVMNKVA